MTTTAKGHAGDLAWEVMRRWGVQELFTLNGAHVWPLYDAAAHPDTPAADRVRLIDTRHEQTATFAAEGVAKLTRRPGVAALTAGPGVTNGVSAVTTAHFNGSPLVVLGGRAAQATWGIGSLQEFDHLPLMASITKAAVTLGDAAAVPARVHELLATAMAPHRGPVFADLPIDVIFSQAEAEVPEHRLPPPIEPDGDEVARAGALLAGAERPVIVAGSDVWWDGAWDELRRCAEQLRIPVVVNGMGRGCIPSHHELAISRARSKAFGEADVVCVVGTPLDFRLGYGSFSASVIHVADHPDGIAGHVELAARPAGHLAAVLDGFADTPGERRDHEPWIEALRGAEEERRAADEAMLRSDAAAIHPARVYGELRSRLDPDAVMINDGGDFVSFAGRFIDSQQPGCWLDPGPFGCLGTGLGYAIAARVVHPDRQVVALIGDGALGFSGFDVDTLVRHDLPVVMVVGNNSVWGLEKHPMQMICGYDAACDLQPATRYDKVVEALGGAGETVDDPAEVGPAIERALASGVPYLVNVLTDPAVAYPRSSNLI